MHSANAFEAKVEVTRTTTVGETSVKVFFYLGLIRRL